MKRMTKQMLVLFVATSTLGSCTSSPDPSDTAAENTGNASAETETDVNISQPVSSDALAMTKYFGQQTEWDEEILLALSEYSGADLSDAEKADYPALASVLAETKSMLVRSMEDESFRVAILRPPMVYGKDCKGNFVTLTKFALKSPVFPSIKNKRSMIFVDNLSEFVRRVIDRGEGGLYFPQNGDYVCTSEMVEYIAMYSGKRIRLTGLFDPIIPHVKAKVFRKVFGDLFYDFQDDAVDTVPFEESVRLSVSHE